VDGVGDVPGGAGRHRPGRWKKVRHQATWHVESGLEGHQIDPGSSWTWVQRSPGAHVSASHWIIPQAGGRTLVRQRLDQRGLLGGPVGRLMAKKTKRFLEQEAHGLKARSEQLGRASGSHA
jgi:hypothetical protein